MKKLIVLFALVTVVSMGWSQKYITKDASISFFSSTPIEDIEAENNTVNCAFDINSGAIVFKVLMKSFSFEKALMQEHFNENYIESDKYPNATLRGQIVDYKSIDPSKDGIYELSVSGELTIHGVSRQIEEKGTIKVQDGKIICESVFMIAPEDYDIKIPKAVIKNIAKEIQVKVYAELTEYKRNN